MNITVFNCLKDLALAAERFQAAYCSIADAVNTG